MLSLASSWGILHRPGDLLGLLGASWGSLGALLGCTGASYWLLGLFWGSLEASWGRLGASKGSSWGLLGDVLGHLGPSWGLFVTSWGHLAGLSAPKAERGRGVRLILAFLGRVSSLFFVCVGCICLGFVHGFPILS